MTKRFLRICSMFLSLVMVFQMLPLRAIAEEYMVSTPAAVSAENTDVSNSQIVAEVEEHRTEFSKEFKLDNGLYVSAVYAQPVHYEVDGAWEEIDNTLRTQLDGTYTNTAGVWDVYFPQQLTKSNTITIAKDGHTLSFGMAGELRQQGNLEVASAAQTAALIEGSETFHITVNGSAQTFAVQSAQTAQGQIQTIDLSQAKEEARYEEFVVGKNTSQLLYTNVYANTDIRYDLKANQVKESVILESYSSTLRGYRYTLNVGDMVPVLQDDNSIYFYDAEQKNVVMVMPAPYLVDAAYATNYDVTVSLTQNGSAWTLTYLLPTSWLAAEERSWPVVLDPVVIADLSDENIHDTTVISARPSEADYMRSTLQIGYSANDGISRIYLGFENLPTLTSSDVIVQAEVSIYKIGTGTSTIPATVHKVNSSWQVENLCWNNAPGFSSTIEDYAMVTNGGRYYWNVTDIVRDWYTGENNGLVIKATDEVEQSGDTNTWKEFYSCNYGDDPTDPALLIYFRNNNGLESYWDYTSASAGRAGTGYVNNYTGNLVWVHNDIGFGGNRMPVSISHVYNANDAIEMANDGNNSNDSGGNYFGLGTGWRTNFHQRLYQWNGNDLITYYIWEDSDGTDHYFTAGEDGVIRDEDGLELTLTTNGSGTTKYCIEDKNGNKSYFDTYGRLTKQENNQEVKSNITVTYESSSPRISMITDGAGRKYSFTYSGNLLSRISYKGTGSTEVSYVTFTYSGNLLTRITDKDGKYATYTYIDNFLEEPCLLASATDVDGYKLSYSYNTTSGAHQPYRVNRVVESDGSALGGELTFSYAHNETTITDVVNNQKQIIQFNNFGNTVSIQDDQGRAQYAQYANNDSLDTQSTEKANQLRLSSKLQNTVGNLLKDSSFEQGATWEIWPSGSVTVENTTEAAYLGTHSVKLSVSESASEWCCMMANAYTLAAGETCTFSAYLKGVTGNAYLMISNRNDLSGEVEHIVSGSTGWKRGEVSYTNTSNTPVPIFVHVYADPGSQVYVDCVQAEISVTASRYNLIENGDFRYGSYGWIYDCLSGTDGIISTDTPTSATELDNTVVQITGDPTTLKHVYQQVKVSGAGGDTFVLSGWAKGDSVPLSSGETDTNVRDFGLYLCFNYTDGSYKTFCFHFNPDADSSTNWQYGAWVAVAEKAYSSVNIDIRYDYNANTACFDGIQLYKEEFGTSYTYDADGNVISVKDLQGQVTNYEYNTDGELYQILQGNKAKMTYTYDDWHNVETATSEEGIVYEFTYDDYGNNTVVSIVSGSERITSTAAYTSDGNRLVSTADALGQTTTYSYNADTNMLEWVQYPNDTDGNHETVDTRTKYTYDSMYRTASAAVTTDWENCLSADYTYENDLLTEIETASTIYSFTYGDFALRTAVKIGNRTLASYEYTDDRNYYLEKLAYGNGDSVQYTYDDLGRIVKQTYEDGDTVTYQYNNDGDLASVTDSAAGITTTYYYDLSGRLMKYVESGRRSHTVTYSYDTENNLTSVYDSISGTTSYTYDEDNRVEAVTNGNSDKSYFYDELGRLSETSIKHNDEEVFYQVYDFEYNYNGTTSTQLSEQRSVGNDFDIHLEYTYDPNGNIRSISDGTYTTSYMYDSQNQLIQENNQKLNKTWVWEYDNAGNILSKSEYAYTVGGVGTANSTKTYTYADSQWGDLLTNYNGKAITYDEVGNMLTYGNKTFTWEHGRQLAAINTWKMTYDADGTRLERYNSSTGRRYIYYYSGSQLTKMNVSDDEVHGQFVFKYDANGTPLSADYYVLYWVDSGYWDENDNYIDDSYSYEYRGTYYYVTNIQGDVIALVDESGNKVMEYTYDAWGKILRAIDYNDFYEVADFNPLRYRGYVYDMETGLYYLQSRYYDPEIGRFINADAFVSTGQGVLGNNMFAYCGNNPVNNVDPLGTCYYNAKGQWCHDNWEYLGGYERKPEPNNHNEKSALETAKQVATSIWNNLEVSGGIGLGLYAEVEVLELGISGGIYYNPLYVELTDGTFKIHQEYFSGIAFSLGFVHFGYTESMTRTYTTVNPIITNNGIFGEETITLFSVACYPIAGGSFRIGFDLNSFLKEIDEIFFE